jgi:hypothetical protein
MGPWDAMTGLKEILVSFLPPPRDVLPDINMLQDPCLAASIEDTAPRSQNVRGCVGRQQVVMEEVWKTLPSSIGGVEKSSLEAQ